MTDRPRIFWQVLDVADEDTLWTLGWKPDSSTLRWSLSSAVRLEGLRDGWGTAMEVSESALLRESYVGINEEGDTVETTKDGETASNEVCDKVVAATIAKLTL